MILLGWGNGRAFYDASLCSAIKTPHTNAKDSGDTGLIPGPRRSSGEGNGNPFQYSCLEDHMDRGAWWATVQGVAKSWTQLRNSMHTLLPVGNGSQGSPLVFAGMSEG